MRSWFVPFTSVAFVVGTSMTWADPARATLYRVGPGRLYEDPGEVLEWLEPGDVVEVDGDAVYPGDFRFTEPGTEKAKIVIRGVRINGRRPVLEGGDFLVNLRADHYVFEGFEVTGASSACIFVGADDITVRDTVVHDCARHGILAGDEEAGSQTYEYVELYRNGHGETKHQMYVTTDQVLHPGSVLRVSHSYFHDGNGGNNLKSRAERNEIRYNWIEGAAYHELDLIGPEIGDESLAREDSDVVGNVLVKSSPWYAARIGGDGSGQTHGRYRFAYNTILIGDESKAAIYLQDGVESLELSNNVFVQPGGGWAEIVRDKAAWASGEPVIRGARNWVTEGCEGIPDGLDDTIRGTDPRFVDMRSFDMRPAPESPLIDAADMGEGSFSSMRVPSPLLAPQFLPPPARLLEVGAAVQRVPVKRYDIGSFEYGNPEANAWAFRGEMNCTCRAAPGAPGGTSAALAALALAALAGRRRARR